MYPQTTTEETWQRGAIQTFTNHFKAIIAGVDDSFPMKLWDKLLPQTVLTLNLLCQSNFAPTVSACQYVRGNFNYNKMPLAPMGCAVQLHKSSERKGKWAENTTNGWYIQISPEHYHCHKIHVKKTNSKRVSDTVFFKHKYITQPTLTLADILTEANDDLIHALKGRRNTKGTMELEALQKLDKLLNQAPQAQTPLPRQVSREEATTSSAPTQLTSQLQG